MRTVQWPERETFLTELDRLKHLKGIGYDSDLAERAGISHSAISNWRRGVQRPSLTAIQGIARALGARASDLAETAGLVGQQFADTPDGPTLPAEIEQFISLYRRLGDKDRADLLVRLDWVNEWAASRAAAADEAPARRRRDVG